MDFVYLIVGGALLFIGGEALVKGSVSLARQFNLSNFLIGAVVVGFGTSMPELSVSIKAALDNSSGIVIGNVVGSNTANILLVLGASALVAPIAMKDNDALRDAFVVLGASLILCGVSYFVGVFDLISGSIMFALLLVYIFGSYYLDKKKTQAERDETFEHVDEDIEGDAKLNLPMAILYTIAGMVILVVGAWLFVDGAEAIARQIGVSEAVIGLSLVALGTSLPELATSLVAAMKKHGDVIVGNVVGSSVFNILAILAMTAMIKDVSVAQRIVDIDMWVMLGATVLIIPFLWTDRSVSRIEGIIMLGLYFGYMTWMYYNVV